MTQFAVIFWWILVGVAGKQSSKYLIFHLNKNVCLIEYVPNDRVVKDDSARIFV